MPRRAASLSVEVPFRLRLGNASDEHRAVQRQQRRQVKGAQAGMIQTGVRLAASRFVQRHHLQDVTGVQVQRVVAFLLDQDVLGGDLLFGLNLRGLGSRQEAAHLARIHGRAIRIPRLIGSPLCRFVARLRMRPKDSPLKGHDPVLKHKREMMHDLTG